MPDASGVLTTTSNLSNTELPAQLLRYLRFCSTRILQGGIKEVDIGTRGVVVTDMAADPTYPLYPIASVVAAALLFLVLLTSFVRQSWNFGIASLCFWLFCENLLGGINAVIWSDNFDVKLHVYCDICEGPSHLWHGLVS